jgi:hypothetical protein
VVTYQWFDPAPHYDKEALFVQYSNWLADNVGKQIWCGRGYPVKQLSQVERDDWNKIGTAMIEIDPKFVFQPKLRNVDMHEGEGWMLFSALWYLDHEYAHKVMFLLRAEDPATLVHFKLACL